MQVILLKDVKGVGRRHEVKNLADGHARFIIAQKFGLMVDDTNLKQLEALKRGTGSINEDELKQMVKSLAGVTIELRAKANPQGHLFAAVHEPELIQALKKQAKVNLEKHNIIKLVKPLKEVGEHEVLVEAGGAGAKFKVVIKPL